MALRFDGTNYLDCGDQTALEFAGVFTVSVWIKTTATGNNEIASKGGGVDWEWALFRGDLAADPTEVRAILSNTPGSSCADVTTTGQTINDGVWHHILVIYNFSTKVEIFVDGVSAGSTTTFSGTPGVGASPFRAAFATFINRTNFEGDMDDLRLYNRAIALSEVDDIYSARGGDSIYNGLALRLRMDEKAAGTAASAANSVIDISNNGFTANPVTDPIYQESQLRKRRRAA